MTTVSTDLGILPQRREARFSWTVAGRTGDVAHRETGVYRDIVLVHGLAMSSGYFARFANVLFQRGWSPIAPDIPGFGRSGEAPAGGVEQHAAVLMAWADALGIRNAVWVGHSVSCNVVAHIARVRPDLLRAAVFIGPLWTRGYKAHLRFLIRLLLDGLHEPIGVYPFAIRSFFRAGIRRWYSTWQQFAPDLAGPPSLPRPALYLAGERDPLPDRSCVPLVEVSGAHACFVSHPDETAEAISGWLARSE